MGALLSSVPHGAYSFAREGFKRLRAVWFNLVQTSVAAGVAWYLTHDVLGHPQPFFAPIAAAASMSISNVLRAQRAVQMMIGVTLGIGLGTLVQGLLGHGAIPIAVAALIALLVAVFIGHGFIGQGMMFANQAVISVILVLALGSSGATLIRERSYDAVIGGLVAIVFAIGLFPVHPLKLLREARIRVLDVLHGVLTRTADVAAGQSSVEPDWAVDRVHQQLNGLIEARSTARQVVRLAPRRWGLRDSVRAAEYQAVYLALLAGSVLQLARAVVDSDCHRVPPHVHAALVDLAAAAALADPDPAGASAYTAAAHRHASELHATVCERTEVVLAEAVQACIDDLQRVIDIPH